MSQTKIDPSVGQSWEPARRCRRACSLPAKYEFFKVVQDYLDRAAAVIELPDYIRLILSQPKNEIIVHFPVRMDNGDIRLFKGYRIQHSNILGPFKGGMRYHESVTLDDLKALASMMTWKCALMQIPFGGGKGRHQVQPAHRVARPSCSASRAASFTRSATTSAPTTTSPRPTWAPTRRSWRGPWTRT